MSLSSRITPRAWIIALACACGFVAWTDLGRVRRIDYVSALAGRAEPDDRLAASSPTGYARGQRELILPARSESSYHWIIQTQQMFARREWRVRRVDYDNAPSGRTVNAASPYRWWLGLVAGCDHLVSGRPIGLSVERAALVADPALHGLLLIGTAVFVAWRFGVLAAVLVSLGLAAIYPLGAAFSPGVPDHRGLAVACAFWSVLLLLAGLRSLAPGRDGPADRRAVRWFALAGIAGGVGVWISVPLQVPVLAGILVGVLIAAWAGRRRAEESPAGIIGAAPWRAWALAGAVTVLLAFLIEYFPAHLATWRLEAIHPLYGLAWLGGAELVARAAAWIQRTRPSRGRRGIAGLALAAAGVAAVPVVMMLADTRGFLVPDLLALRLTNQSDGVVAANLWTWLLDDGTSLRFWTTLLPLVLVAPAVWLLGRSGTGALRRASLGLALGPVAVALGFGCLQLGWWSLLDGLLLALLAAAVANPAPPLRRAGGLWSLAAAACVIPGAVCLWPAPEAAVGQPLNTIEAEELIERDLAHWLARHAGDDVPVVYAPPNETITLCFYGGLRGVGTFTLDNRAGLGATMTIASVTTLQEAQVLLQGRGIRYIIVPSWDSFFDEYTRLYLAGQFRNWQPFFIPELRRWNLPPWLRPVPYQMPKIGGFEDQSVLLFEVVDEQSPAVAASRLAEYLVEIGELGRAAAVGEGLRRFPGDVGALAARAQVASARDDPAGLAQALETLQARLASGADRYLTWDRRVSLAIVLARAKRIEPAREQARRCLAELDAPKVRSLSTGSLYNLLALGRAFGLPVADPRLQALALDLLPADLRARLGP